MATPSDPDLYQRKATSFGEAASAYAEHRPDYPGSAVRWAVEPLPTVAGAHVLDLGAGTGKLTEVLTGQGLRTTAVEPDPAMLAELRSRLPDVTALSGGAERIPLPDDAVDAVLVGQAFHWFDPERAMPEIGRVLRPGGVLAALWNIEDDGVEWVAGLAEVSRSEVSAVKWQGKHGIPAHTSYTSVEHARFAHAQPRTVASLVATLATHSRVLVLPEHERAETLESVRSYLASRPETAGDVFDLPIVTFAQRTRLR